jgi:hypothetical protein
MEDVMASEQEVQQLVAFDYHIKVRDYFKSRKKTWDWFAKQENKEEQNKKFKAEILKNTYRLEKTDYEKLYKACEDICKVLNSDATVILYQENNSVQLNAQIIILENEAHIALSGNVLTLLTDEEFKALMAHELSHYLFTKMDNGDFEITQRIILALANDSRSEDVIIETARLFQLYLELFCDAGALKACGDYKPVIQALVKMHTGISAVNAESYLKQAKEILESDTSSSKNFSHPEAYIRSVATAMRHEGDKEYKKTISNLIEGNIDLNKLDIFRQQKLHNFTYDLLQLVVKPSFMGSSAITNLCQQYYKDFHKKEETKTIEEIIEAMKDMAPTTINFIAYLFLDIAKVDTDMEGIPMGHTLEISELLGMKTEYEKIIRKEMNLTIRDFKKMQESVMDDLQKVSEDKSDSIYTD